MNAAPTVTEPGAAGAARAAAALLDDAAAAGLAAPASVAVHGYEYGRPHAALHLDGGHPDARNQITAWAIRHGGSLTASPSAVSPCSTRVDVRFTFGGIRATISTIIPGHREETRS